MAQPRFKSYPVVSDQVNAAQLGVLWRELQTVLADGVTGDVVEFGCYVGTTSLFLQRAPQSHPAKQLHVYDSLAGLPAKVAQDASRAGEAFQAGELSASRRQLERNFRAAGLPLPVIHKAWFDQLQPADVPEQLCFAFLDGDFYHSILDSLRLVWPRLQSGSRLVIDDYQREALPGVAKAVHDYFASRGGQPAIRIEHDLGIIRL